ncbi:type II secretory pathway, pseudopilin PulG [Opitutaceae bacterium TAV5]|nr:type II secretory pathway, pseudopilin PulG [Opitutaceae bacterium TAV5]
MTPRFPHHVSLRSRPVTGRRAFTLVELLAVIAIIGVLAAILIPVVSRVRQSARSAVCIKNLQSIGVAFQLYAADNRGLFPAAKYDEAVSNPNPSKKTWQVEISPYLGREVQYFSTLKAEIDGYAFCPEYISKFRNHPDWTTYTTAGYGMSNKLHVGAGINPYTTRFPHTNIDVPSRRFLVGDSNNFHILIDGSTWTAGATAGTIGSSGDPKRHNGRANYLFADGHVASLTPEKALESYKAP